MPPRDGIAFLSSSLIRTTPAAASCASARGHTRRARKTDHVFRSSTGVRFPIPPVTSFSLLSQPTVQLLRWLKKNDFGQGGGKPIDGCGNHPRREMDSYSQKLFARNSTPQSAAEWYLVRNGHSLQVNLTVCGSRNQIGLKLSSMHRNSKCCEANAIESLRVNLRYHVLTLMVFSQ